MCLNLNIHQREPAINEPNTEFGPNERISQPVMDSSHHQHVGFGQDLIVFWIKQHINNTSRCCYSKTVQGELKIAEKLPTPAPRQPSSARILLIVAFGQDSGAAASREKADYMWLYNEDHLAVCWNSFQDCSSSSSFCFYQYDMRVRTSSMSYVEWR